LDIFENEALGFNHPAVLNGPTKEHRDFYRNPALGGEVMLGGMDNPTKLFSTQYDWIYFNECQETTEEKWESLHRALRGSTKSHAGGNTLPFKMLIGDCNPDHEYHWANQRAASDRMHRLVGRFWDNPRYFDWEKQEWTDEGVDYISRLRENLTGPRHDRLYRGKWVAAEGQIWPDYDPRVHLINGTLTRSEGRTILQVPEWEERSEVELLWFLGGQDIGFEAPGCAQVWGFDRDGRAYRVAEIYRTHWDHDQWASAWKELQAEFQPLKAILTDWDPAFQKNLNQRLHAHEGDPIAIPWAKLRGPGQEKVGIDDVRIRMKPRADGTRGFYLLRDCHRYYPDPLLKEKRQPLSFEEEIAGWVYSRPKDGQKIAQDKKDEPDPTCPDHACDTARGVLSWGDIKRWIGGRKPEKWGGDTYGAAWTAKLKRNQRETNRKWQKRKSLILPKQLQ
jgi:phage terminase large subunit